MYGYIYKTTNIETGKIYIGQKKSPKFLGNSYLGSGTRLKSSIAHYGKEKFKVELLEECDCKDLLNQREIYWISHYNSRNPSIGYNLARGGEGSDATKGFHLSKEHRQKISKSTKGRSMSYETRLKMSNSARNRKVSAEARHKMSKSRLGHSVSVATRNKISIKLMGNQNAEDKHWQWSQESKENAKGKHVLDDTKFKISTSLHEWHQQHPNYRNDGNFKLGQEAFNKGHFWVTNVDENHYATEETFPEWEAKGFWRGTTKFKESYLEQLNFTTPDEVFKFYMDHNEQETAEYFNVKFTVMCGYIKYFELRKRKLNC